MPDHDAGPPSAREEEMLDLWLDALNDPDGNVPPAPPEIAGFADVARRYRNVLGMTQGATSHRAVQKGSRPMNRALPQMMPPRQRKTISLPNAARGPGWMRWVARGLASAMVMALLIVLVGGPLIREYGLTGGFGEPKRLSSIVGAPDAAPTGEALSCAAPGYRPVVEGEINEETLAAIGISQQPLHIDDDHVNIPTSSGETVTLPNTWTPLLGGPLWANTVVPPEDRNTIVRNIETGQEWTFPSTEDFFPGVYYDPYLLVPAGPAENDWRIIDTRTGDERLISEIRGESFPGRVRISQIGFDYDLLPPSVDTSVWLFNSATHPEQDIGSNALVLPQSLADAAFIADTIDAEYHHQTAYSPETNRLAFATGNGEDRAIVILEPESGDTMIVHDERFSDQALPLMFSNDGSSLIVDQPDAIFSVSLTGDPVVTLVYEDDQFVPIAHNAESMNVLVMFDDRHIAIINARSGEITDLPDVTVPKPEYAPSDPMFRMSFDTQVYDLFNDSTGMVRFINLRTATVSPETAVLDLKEDYLNAPFQPQFQLIVRYPYVDWSDAYAFLDENGTFHGISTTTDKELLSIPAPDDFSVEANQVVQLLVNPNERCIVLNVVQPSGDTGIQRENRPDRVTSWIAPLEPGSEWTKLDIALTGWWEVYEGADIEILPAMDIATPIATP